MFGHQDDPQQSQTTDATNVATTSNDDSQATSTFDSSPYIATPTASATQDESTSDSYTAPADTPTSAPSLSDTTPMPATDTSSDATSVSDDANDLLDIKQQALTQLSPLVDHLDQSAEEKFRTTMMMIQAADNQSLLKTAFEAAQQITDDKARAQALLDIINEINYFTQHQAS